MTRNYLYPEEIKAQAIERRRRQFARRLNTEVVLEISDITDDTQPRRIQVQTRTGRLVWLPRSAVEFLPGSVVLPAWLFDKVKPYFQPTA